MWADLNPQELAHLGRDLQRVPPRSQFELLATAFFENDFLGQSYAGKLLVQLSPPCPHVLSQVLPQLLPGWNLSIEELPFYLANTFGQDALLAALEEVDAQRSPGYSKTRTVRYWLRARRIGR